MRLTLQKEILMRESLRFVFPIIVVFILAAQPSWGRGTDEAEIRAAIGHYFLGQATGNGEHYREAFHPQAQVFSVEGGRLAVWTLDEFIARSPGRPPADEAQRKRTIDTIEISGTAALVRLTLDYPTVVFTDYMSMLKVDGRWLIVNKTFDRGAPR
jgi:hypothetical protein